MLLWKFGPIINIKLYVIDIYMYVCVLIRMYVRMYVHMYVCMYMYVHMYVCMCVTFSHLTSKAQTVVHN